MATSDEYIIRLAAMVNALLLRSFTSSARYLVDLKTNGRCLKHWKLMNHKNLTGDKKITSDFIINLDDQSQYILCSANIGLLVCQTVDIESMTIEYALSDHRI